MTLSPKIVLRTGWATKNVGDAAHTPGTLRLLYDRFPDAEITVWSNGLNASMVGLLKRRFPSVSIVGGHLYEEGKPTPAPLVAAFDAADLFIINSGMLLNYGLFSYNWDGPVYNLSPCWRCLERGISFGMFGQSFDLFAEPSPALFRPTLNQAAFIFTRESESARYLSELGMDEAVVAFGPDGVFGLDVRDDDTALHWLAEHDLESGEFLILNIRTNTPVSSDSHSPLNPVDLSPEHHAENERWMDTCARVIECWVRETGRKVLIAPEAVKEIEAARELLLPRLDPAVREYVVCREEWWIPDEAFSFFSHARVAFGMEPHTLIMALCGGVPIVHARPLRHGRKGWMFKDIGLGDCLFDIDETPAEEVAARVVKLGQENTKARGAAADAMRIVRGRQARMLDVIEETIQPVKV